jgi:hypothetical protein
MTFTIPLEATMGHSPIKFRLNVETDDDPSPQQIWVSVSLKCHVEWFFADESGVSACPLEPVRSYAAAQHFERGTMIWIEQLGRYVILSETPLYEGETRKRVDNVYDPLEITHDTSIEVHPPPGLYAPESGFGLVWRGDVGNSPGYRELFGWALAPEFGYEALYQCNEGYPSGGIFWQLCFLKGPDDEIIFFHPLGGWYLLSEQENPL